MALIATRPYRTYETSGLGARRSFGHVLNDQRTPHHRGDDVLGLDAGAGAPPLPRLPSFVGEPFVLGTLTIGLRFV